MEAINYDYFLDKYNPLLHKFANRYLNVVNKTLFNYDDLYSISSVGLVLALQTYKEDRGMSLLSHICQTIQYEMYRQTLGKSKKEIQNAKLNNLTNSIYEKISNDNQDSLVIDTIPDNSFSYDDVDYEIDLKREFRKILKIMHRHLEFEEEVIMLDLFFHDKKVEEVAAKFNSTEIQMKRRKDMILRKLRAVPYIKEIRKQIVQEKIKEIDEVDSIKAFFTKEGLLNQLEEML